MGFACIARHRHIWLRDVLEASRSGFRAWLNRLTSGRECHDAKLVTEIDTSFNADDRTYGKVASGAKSWTRGWPAGFTGLKG